MAAKSSSEAREIVHMIQKSLECSICLELMTEPYRTHCNHPFCKLCINTVLSSNKDPRCPLCKEPITRRSVHANSHMGEIVSAVQQLADAVVMDTGLTNTPPPVVSSSRRETTGSPGILLHSLLHPTPTKPSK